MQLKHLSSFLLLASLLSCCAGTAVAAPAQQELLDQSRAQQERLGEERVETIAAPPSSNTVFVSKRFYHRNDMFHGKYRILHRGPSHSLFVIISLCSAL